MAVVRCVRAHPARLSVAQHRDLSLLRFRRPFADTGGDLSPTPAATFRCQRPNPFQLRVKLEANDVKFRIRLQSFSAQVEGSDRSISSTSSSVLESIMIGDSVFRRQPTSALNLRLGRKYTRYATVVLRVLEY